MTGTLYRSFLPLFCDSCFSVAPAAPSQSALVSPAAPTKSVFAAGLFSLWLSPTFGPGGNAFAVKCLLQRPCHAPSNPYASVTVATPRPVDTSFASRVDSNSTRSRPLADAPRQDVPGGLLARQSARPACGRGLRHIPVNYADASEPYLVFAAPCPMCRKPETRQIPNYSSVSYLP